MKRRLDIDGLRAVAVLLVVASHLNIEQLKGGFIGVDIFFVISGYVITLNLISEYVRRGTSDSDFAMISIRGFYARRIKRIFPITLFITVINLICGFFLFNKSKFQELIVESLNNIFFLGNFYQIRIGTDYLTSTMADTPLRHLWSLSIEEQFYLVYPLLCLLLLSLHGLQIRGQSVTWNTRLIVAFSSISLISFIYSTYEVWDNPPAAYFSTIGRVWEIGVGCIVCLFETKLPPRWYSKIDNIAPMAGLVLIAFSVIQYDATTRFPGIAALVPVLGAALIVRRPIYPDRPGIVKRLLSTNLLVFIGKLSFSIYLWHWSLIIFIGFKFPTFLEGNFARGLVFLVVIILSILTYKFIEIPCSKLNIYIPPIVKFKEAPNLLLFIKNKIAPDVKMFLNFSLFIALIATSLLVSRGAVKSDFEYIDPANLISEFEQPTTSQNLPLETTTSSSTFNLSREVALGAQITQYSTTITPKIEELKTAQWGLTLLGNPSCKISNESARSQNTADCIKTGLGSAGKVLMLGDSHAFMLAPSVFDYYDKKISLRILGRSGCPTGGVMSSTNQNKNHIEYCNSLWTQYIPDVLKLEQFDLIILTDDGGTNLLNATKAVNNIKLLDFKDAKVLFVSPSPRYPNPADCISSTGNISKCFGTPNINGEKVMNEMYKATKSTLVSLSNLVCQGSVCPPVISNTFVTRDGSHFTGAFAKLISGSLNLPVL